MCEKEERKKKKDGFGWKSLNKIWNWAKSEQFHHLTLFCQRCFLIILFPEHIKEKHYNVRNWIYTIDCCVKQSGVKKISWNDQEVIIFTRSDYKDDNSILVELYACQRYCNVLQGSPPDKFLSSNLKNINEESEEIEIPEIAHHGSMDGSHTINDKEMKDWKHHVLYFK